MNEKVLVWDVEANGLLEMASIVHCIAIMDYYTRQSWFYDPGQIQLALDKLSKADVLICHNEIGYDLPLLEKLHQWKPSPGTRLLDTLTWSKYNWPDRQLTTGCQTSYLDASTGKKRLIGPHSLAHFGFVVGNAKPEHSDWETYSDEMGHRCREDVRINVETVTFLVDEMKMSLNDLICKTDLPWFLGGESHKKYKTFSPMFSCSPSPSNGLWLEMAFASICQQQIQRKCQIDIKQLHQNMSYLQEECTKVEERLETQLGLYAKPLHPKISFGTYEKTRIKKFADSQTDLIDVRDKILSELKKDDIGCIFSAFEQILPLLTGKSIKKAESILVMLAKLKANEGKVGWIEKPFKKNGDYSFLIENYMEGSNQQVLGVFSKVEFNQIKLSQRQRIIDVMLRRGWQPTSHTPITEKGGGGNPQLVIDALPCPGLAEVKDAVGKEFVQWVKATKRMEMHTAFKDNMDENYCIPALLDSVGTNTFRVKHKLIANLPRAGGSTFFGSETRSVIGSRENYLMLGSDMSGLENRVAAHYTFPIDDGVYAKEIMEGDCHTQFRLKMVELLGKSCPEVLKDPKEGRNLAKTMTYGILYGCSAKKAGLILGKSEVVGRKAVEAFWKTNKALKSIKDACSKLHDSVGYVIGIDGRKVTTRSSHSAMNGLFQSAGSIIFKMATVIAHVRDPDMEQLISYHDEMQLQVKEDEVKTTKPITEEQLTKLLKSDSILSVPSKTDEGWICCYHPHGEVFVKAARFAGRVLKTNVEFDAEYKIGKNWALTH